MSERMRGQICGEMRLHANRPDTGTAPSVGDTKSLMQVQVADIRAEVARPGEAHKRIQICAIHIHLSAMAVNDVTDFRDALLEHTVS